MEPTLREGEQVRVRAGHFGVGDVILFETGAGELELHRVIARWPGVIVHRGDNPEAVAGVVRPRRVVGRAEMARVRPGAVEIARAVIGVSGRTLRSRLRRAIGRRG
jgi:hypothetical protein